jgi:hypothetical protein
MQLPTGVGEYDAPIGPPRRRMIDATGDEARLTALSIGLGVHGSASVYFHPAIRLEDAVNLRRVLGAWAATIPADGATR